MAPNDKPTCETCRFWREKARVGSRARGVCDSDDFNDSVHTRWSAYALERSFKINASDAADITEIRTQHSFGCIFHEARTQTDG